MQSVTASNPLDEPRGDFTANKPMPSDLQLAIDAIKAKLPECQLYIDYYDGKHKLTFASDRFATTFGETLKGFRDNLCPIVVDAPADRMEVLNFSGDDKSKAKADPAWQIWQRETLELVSNDVHKNALKCGYGYLIVWPDETGTAKFYPQDSRKCVVIENEDTGRKMFAAKQWMTADKFVRVTLYYADRIEKYITIRSVEGSMELKDTAFQKLNIAGENAFTENPYGVIPMFCFETAAVLGDAIPLQNALNKTFADRLVAQEFGAFRQRWATGLTPPPDELTGIPTLPFKAGVDRLWFADGEGVKFGEFTATDLMPFLHAADSDRLSMARVTGTPLHFFGLNSKDVPSGEALKTLESRFTKKVHRLTLNFGVVWANVMRFALQIEGKSTGEDNLATQWQAVETRSEKEQLDAAVIKQDLSIPDEVLWEELGYTEEDIAKFKKMQDAQPVVDPAVAAMAAMANGNPKAA
jgi:hypothetical protein